MFLIPSSIPCPAIIYLNKSPNTNLRMESYVLHKSHLRKFALPHFFNFTPTFIFSPLIWFTIFYFISFHSPQLNGALGKDFFLKPYNKPYCMINVIRYLESYKVKEENEANSLQGTSQLYSFSRM